MPSILKEDLKRFIALRDEILNLNERIYGKERKYTTELIESVDAWAKFKDKVQELIFLDQGIDLQEKQLQDPAVPESTKEVLRIRLQRDIEDAPKLLKSALRLEKKTLVQLEVSKEYLSSLDATNPKDSAKEEKPAPEPKKEKPKPAPKLKKTTDKETAPIEQKIIQKMEDAVDSFQKGIPEIEKGAYNALLEEVKNLQLQGGKIVNNIQNLKQIMSIKNKLERLIINEGYKDNVKEFVNAFDIVEALQLQYFADFNFKFKPSKTLPIIKQMAVDSTINDLLGQGLSSNVIDRVGSILQDNITSGGSYASLNDQLRSTIVGGEANEGLLQRYSKTITTDAINQYSAQYHETIAKDLSLSWGRYIGSNLTTTREFCEFLTKKEWVHKSELPAIIGGEIDGHTCKLSKSTGLPLGMIPGTNADNFKIRRGGYNCGHQFFWVPDLVVPADVKLRIA